MQTGRPRRNTSSALALGQWIRERREEDLSFSQSELAEVMGVSRTSVNKWESGRTTPPIDKVCMIHCLVQKAREGAQCKDQLMAEAGKLRSSSVHGFVHELTSGLKSASVLSKVAREAQDIGRRIAQLPREDRKALLGILQRLEAKEVRESPPTLPGE
ncbi:MAG: helix-turn-helix transcriptional regulator [Armatimonadetes bacterium]|nr:helix-turn-helix transcriptional regulator [Armatimonadota bacterium]